MREREQIETVPTSAKRIMGHPYFAKGVADARAGKGFPRDYDEWAEKDNLWAYERGRMFGKLAPPDLPLNNKNGTLSAVAVRWFCSYGEDIL